MKKTHLFIFLFLSAIAACKKDDKKSNNETQDLNKIIGTWRDDLAIYKEWQDGNIVRDDTAIQDDDIYGVLEFNSNKTFSYKLDGNEPIPDSMRISDHNGTYSFDGTRVICSWTFSYMGYNTPMKDTFQFDPGANKLRETTDFSYLLSGVKMRIYSLRQYKKMK